MDAADVRVIDGREFASWSVLPGGTQARLDLVAGNGKPSSIVLPFDVLSSLLFTLPRILQAALDERCAEPSMRVVHPLGTWRLERAHGEPGMILRLGTIDGFEVAFALSGFDAGSIGPALLAASDHIEQPSKVRRPH
jgi:hypothetical protein